MDLGAMTEYIESFGEGQTGKLYEFVQSVQKGDRVLDIGASVGLFTVPIMKYEPDFVFCVEPSTVLFPTLLKNTNTFDNVYCINAGVYHSNIIDKIETSFGEGVSSLFTFKDLINIYNIQKIDYFKTDCEGWEYEIFKDENMEYLSKIRFITGEWHLGTPELKQKFRQFRDTYLRGFKKYVVSDFTGSIDITWDLWNEHFIEYYSEVLLHISEM